MDEREYYIQQHRQMHRVTKRFRGHSLVPHIAEIDRLMAEHGCDTLLDYGCGKAAYWPDHWRVTGYDPAYEPYSQRPGGTYDMVICTDVMEHIPESATASTLREIFGYSRRWVYLSISTRTSDKQMPAGGSVHVNVKPRTWWQEQLAPYESYTAVYDD
jgi:hypothetical protein